MHSDAENHFRATASTSGGAALSFDTLRACDSGLLNRGGYANLDLCEG